MAPPQRMRVANEKASKYITMRGNVPKSSVSAYQSNIIYFLCQSHVWILDHVYTFQINLDLVLIGIYCLYISYG